jgi:putative redox protein
MHTEITAHTTTARYKTAISNDRHSIFADEPLDLEGTDLGFTPTELLSGALASCTSITLRMYADRKAWPLTDIKVNVSFERDAKTSTTAVVRKIELFGELDEEQRARLLTIANSCPVHRILSGQINIDSRWA